MGRSRRFDQDGPLTEVLEHKVMQSPIAVRALKRLKTRFRTEDAGQDLLEYGLLMSLIAIVAMVAVGTLGTVVRTFFWETIANNF
jgi:Flp pilus assembly pilin Flp